MSLYDPFKHHRRSTRLKEWDYRSPGYYFVTICTHQRENKFENHAFHDIATNALQRIPKQRHAQHIRLDVWIVMPNHVHLILWFVDWPSGVGLKGQTAVSTLKNATAGSLGVVVGQYKKAVTIPVNQLQGVEKTAVWQRGYYERIIRNERELNATRQYILNNPTRWDEDRDNLDALLHKMTRHP